MPLPINGQQLPPLTLAEARGLTKGRTIYSRCQKDCNGQPMAHRVTNVAIWKKHLGRISLTVTWGHGQIIVTQAELDKFTLYSVSPVTEALPTQLESIAA